MSDARTANPLLRVLGRALGAVLNHALTLDEDTRQRLPALEGRAIGIDFSGTGMAMRVVVVGGRLDVGPAFAGPADLTLRASPASLLGMLARRPDSGALSGGKVEISGDAELARRVEKLVREFQPDIEEAFARVFGDVIGYQVAQALRRAFEFGRDGARGLAQDTADYLREESRDLVAPAEMETFLDDVDRLREDADRLAARIARLQQLAAGQRA